MLVLARVVLAVRPLLGQSFFLCWLHDDWKILQRPLRRHRDNLCPYGTYEAKDEVR